MQPDELQVRLAEFLRRAMDAREVRIESLRLLTGGASRQTWSFDATVEASDGSASRLPLVLRTDPSRGPTALDRDTEYHLLMVARDAGVPVPKVHFMGDDSLDSPFFIMERVEGETIPRRVLRDDQYAGARRVMAGQLGAILATLHAIPVEESGLDILPGPPPGRPPAEEELGRFQQVYRAIALEPHPAFELAFRWLQQELPSVTDRTLVHGDYRLGNMIVGPEGVRSVLDWELAHIGDPMEDLGWICVRSWRFGNDDLPVGGVGTREELWHAYDEAGGRHVDSKRVRFWETFGNLRWGIICISQARTYIDGRSPSVELASIGRRIAETEWELLNLMEGR
jgi:aminoglycoside phosphotransferase (APT) family kinase protein